MLGQTRDGTCGLYLGQLPVMHTRTYIDIINNNSRNRRTF